MRQYREAVHASTFLFVGALLVGAVVATTVSLGAQASSDKAKSAMAKSGMASQGPDASGITWGPAPAQMPPGASFALIAGDPSKAGEMYIIRLKGPNGYRVAPHTHPLDEHVTVLKGTFLVGMGEKWDDKAMKAVAAGGHTMAPKETAHFAAFRGETIIEVSGMGPFAMKYVNPEDDPSAKKTGTASK
jgi:quercetin dioxygenase-like cupin family protein